MERRAGRRPGRCDARQIAGGRDVTGRCLPLWLCCWTEAGPGLQAAWNPATDDLPRGFTLPARGWGTDEGDARAAGTLAAEFVAILDAALNEPDAPAATALARMRVLQQCERQIAATPTLLRDLGAGHGFFATATPRGLFWLWENGRSCIGLDGLLHVVRTDRCAPRYRLHRAALRTAAWAVAFGVTIAALHSIAVVVPERHERALADWHARQSPVRRDAARAMLGDPWVPPSPALDLLNAIEGAQADAETTLGEPLPASARQIIAALERRLWRGSLQPALIEWNRMCLDRPATPISGDAEVMRSGIPASGPVSVPGSVPGSTPGSVDQPGPARPGDLYRALAVTLSLTGQQPVNEPLLRAHFARCEATPEMLDNVLHQLARQQGGEPVPVPAPARRDIAAWRAALAGEARYTLDDRLWDGMRDELRPATAQDLDLVDALGAGAFWFESDRTIPWLFTSSGLQVGFRDGHARFADWIAEYRGVVRGEFAPARPSDAELASLDGVLRARYAQEASAAWEALFDTLRLAPARSIGDAVDRAQAFGSDASPFIQLLDTLEQTMPLPPRKTVTLWSRVTTRIATDWARLQYELGWRNSPRPAPQTNDPSYVIAQHFGLLRTYFPDARGKAAARDRLLQTITPIGRYLTRQQAAVEFGGRPPSPTSMKMLKVQAGRLPPPLRRLMQDLANDSGRQLGHEQQEVLSLDLDNVPSYLACRLDAPFPLSPYGDGALDWGTFVKDFAPDGRIAQLVAAHGDVIDATRAPWRLRLPPGAAARPDLVRGIAWLQRATRVGQAWFPPGGGGLTFTFRPVLLSDDALQARLDVDGQGWTYAHGPTRSTTIRWPGPAAAETVDLTLQRIDGSVFRRHYEGPWALLTMAREARRSAMRSASSLYLEFGDARSRFGVVVNAATAPHPLNLSLYRPLCGGRGRRSSGIDLFDPVAPPAPAPSGGATDMGDADAAPIGGG